MISIKPLLGFVWLSLFLMPWLQGNEEETKALRSVHLHLLLNHSSQALEKAQEAHERFPQSLAAKEMLLRAYGTALRDREAFALWKQCEGDFLAHSYREELMETLAWSVIRKAAHSSSSLVSSYGLMAAAFTRDAWAVDQLLSGLSDTNAALRALAAQLCPLVGGHALEHKLEELLLRDSSPSVRLEAIGALAKMQPESALEIFHRVIEDDSRQFKEKMAATQALCVLYKEKAPLSLDAFFQSSHSSLRLLACQLVSFLELREKEADVRALLKDPSPELRLGALSCLMVLGSHLDDSELSGREEPDWEVRIALAWYTSVSDASKAAKAFEALILQGSPKERRHGAAALAAAGKNGVQASRTFFHQSQDLYVKANLALGLIGHEVEVEAACAALYQLLEEAKLPLMWNEDGAGRFAVIEPSDRLQRQDIVNYPELVNQRARLEILKLLAIKEHPQALSALKKFLRSSAWGISSLAAQLSLEEGDATLVDLLELLSKDDEVELRVQAALALVFLAKESALLHVLVDSYGRAPRSLKLRILEALGQVRSDLSQRFLLERLDEPFETLRVAAAASLIQCLNR